MLKTDINQTEYFLFFSKNTILSYNLSNFIDKNSETLQISTIEEKRKLSDHLNKIRLNTKSRKKQIRSSHLNGMVLILETLLFVFHKYQKDNPIFNINEVSNFVAEKIDKNKFSKSLFFFNEEFLRVSNNKIQKNKIKNLNNTKDSNQIMTEELLLLWLANSNPAFSTFTDMFNDQILLENSNYDDIILNIKLFFKDAPGVLKNDTNIIDLLLEPGRKFPNSIFSQLNYIRENWGDILGDFMLKLMRGMDLIKEEEKLGLGGPGKQEVLSYKDISLSEERERFSPDRDWMPNLVLLAKTVYVWLFQLSKKYNYKIEKLDQIPDQELDEMADMGITGLWLIGIWERSKASKQIKQICGNPEAISSAYSIFEYKVSEELGGESAIDNLKYRAEKRGIRLGADMVPNHMGIDSPWVMDKPEHFIHLDYCPYPSHTFNGPDLSSRDDIEIKIEDHYYDRTDAAVEFRLTDKKSGSTKYIYHGNDGTTMPWNDTAQLNYLIPEVREAAIQTILRVSRKFPIIRFDAAMTLTKLHYHRLWFPEPGSGGDIPTRSENGMSKGEFSKIMGEEFWSEVVRRVAEESDDTLLLAEAFWLMEAYFVRTLGMHRVYNSAFMNFLKNEENSQFRTSIKNTIEFNPEILKRFVNFLNNPDEETAVVQFGKDDKYFGVTILVSTLPGLPMFGHGQIEGYSEKYGMEYKRPYWDEKPDEWIIERHYKEIFPVLKKRHLFSGVKNFRLYDFYLHSGNVNEDVIVYSNRFNNESSLIIYHNKFENTAGWINVSSPYLKISENNDKNEMVNETLSFCLGLTPGKNKFVIFKDFISGLEYIRNIEDLNKNGLFVELDAFKYHVFLNFKEVVDSDAKIYSKLNKVLNGKGVYSIDSAVSNLIFKPLLDKIEYFVYSILSEKKLAKLKLEKSVSEIFKIAKDVNNSNIDISILISEILNETNLFNLKKHYLKVEMFSFMNIKMQTIFLLLSMIEKLEYVINKNDIDRWILKEAINKTFLKLKIEDLDPHHTESLLRSLLLYKKMLIKLKEKKLKLSPTDIIDLLSEPVIKAFLGVNIHNNIEWFNKEKAEELLNWSFFISITPILTENNNDLNTKDKEKIKKYEEKAQLVNEAISRSKFHFDLLLKYIEGYSK